MYLKSLNIVGFKTFADETEVILDPGFTAVVGPNGSGKSNIVDALKWVFGEKSAKGLRGDKMDDVIFHGSEARKPAGYAEVSVVFDNSSKLIKMDYPTIKLTRRLYADGNNEYLINDSRVQRKEIEKILLDTGIGKSSYSIMEQGKVDRILHSKPEERRLIFEEAAGISRFKMERQEALKKLSDTNQNLLRIQDIMNTMKKEMEVKEKQAEKAEEYFRLKQELDETDKVIRFLKFDTLTRKHSNSENELKEIKEKNRVLLERISSETGRIELLDSQKSELEKKVAEIDKKLLDHLTQTQIQKDKVESNKGIIQDYVDRIAEIRETLSKEESSQSILQIEKEKLEKEAIDLEGEIKSLEVGIEELRKNKILLEAKIEGENTSIQEKEIRIQSNDKRHVELRDRLKEVIYDLISQLESRKKEALATEEERNRLKDVLLSEADRIHSVSEELRKTLSGSYHEENASQASVLLESLQTEPFRARLGEYFSLEDSIRSMLFDRDGFLSQKEGLDQEIEDLILENENHTRSIKESGITIETLREEVESIREKIVFLEKRILELNSERNSKVEGAKSLSERIEEARKRILTAQESEKNHNSKKSEFEKEVAELEQQIENRYNEFLEMSRALDSEKEALRNIVKEIQGLKNEIQRNQEDYKNLFPILTEKEKAVSVFKVQLESFSEELYNDYSISEQELSDEFKDRKVEKGESESKLKRLKSEIQLLGSINPLSIEEYRNVKEIYEHHRTQKEDIEKSKNDIAEILKNINEESEKLFRETFEKIRENFQETFSTLFNGGRALLELVDAEDSLNAGIEIMAEPPGKHVQNLRLLSGGEKSLTAIALLFAIYMVKPSPFCFLDEIDAALDEANKLRFCQILDKFKDKSQFVVITHAQSTIHRANSIFGVTNEEPGISKIISLRLDQARDFSGKVTEAV
ncbi:chromosome partitioning protein ParA [Leptospira wolffii]|uniref:Chromosome partition protein Smc n=1 Tax=Leptospira wolffii TaxID=409998 RepID=A0A2M9ZCY4_9LEPT|nr:AAA family ATPase [Leptospira wolffii]PJZ66212.1 chromosome partitioning protein ParA [Leptospira wolffii]TGK60235.1 chromosome partitioning protein ParA [Leptospira wolffii]TGK72577.1 chromosome partitioning protein ParA [Leptospira wolffii]TGK76242.1 chromosome partitioning protein ParA [Leptospira wolffii]TGL30494.1 chromosome partitioning protein ParA [Leptospira wolffii]